MTFFRSQIAFAQNIRKYFKKWIWCIDKTNLKWILRWQSYCWSAELYCALYCNFLCVLTDDQWWYYVLINRVVVTAIFIMQYRINCLTFAQLVCTFTTTQLCSNWPRAISQAVALERKSNQLTLSKQLRHCAQTPQASFVSEQLYNSNGKLNVLLGITRQNQL